MRGQVGFLPSDISLLRVGMGLQTAMVPSLMTLLNKQEAQLIDVRRFSDGLGLVYDREAREEYGLSTRRCTKLFCLEFVSFFLKNFLYTATCLFTLEFSKSE